MTIHSKEDALSILNEMPVAAIATSAGEGMRIRMMHYAADDNFNIYRLGCLDGLVHRAAKEHFPRPQASSPLT